MTLQQQNDMMRRRMFAAYSECKAVGAAMTPNEIANKLLTALPAPGEDAHTVLRALLEEARNELAREKARRIIAEQARAALPASAPALPHKPTDAMCTAAREKIGIGANVAEHVYLAMVDEYLGKPASAPVGIDGLGSITDEGAGVLTLRFKDEAAAQAFIHAYEPTVDCTDMPASTPEFVTSPVQMDGDFAKVLANNRAELYVSDSAPPVAGESIAEEEWFDDMLKNLDRAGKHTSGPDYDALVSRLDAHCAKLVAAAEADAEITQNAMLGTMGIQLATIERLQAKLAARAEPDTTALHNDIMNIPCDTSNHTDSLYCRWYKEGHRDARHAAAELVNGFMDKTGREGDEFGR